MKDPSTPRPSDLLVQTGIRMDPDLYQTAKEYGAKHRISLQAIVHAGVTWFLNKYPDGPPKRR